jgi:hypothetical protein
VQDVVRAVLDWPRQKADFEADGSLRDIYVEGATLADWRLFVDLALARPGARLTRAGGIAPMPAEAESLFGNAYAMSFEVSSVVLDCYFFTLTEIEVSFGPEAVTEHALRELLAFMVELGHATNKLVIMTPENWRQSPIFTYSAAEQRLAWLPAD